MKKRWGKPITQVQRFVPQEYTVQCADPKIRLIGVNPNGSGSTTSYNNLYVDYYSYGTSYQPNDGKYQKYEAYFSVKNSPLINSGDYKSVSEEGYNIYQHTGSGSAQINKPYDSEHGFISYNGGTSFYVYNDKIYIGLERTSS